MEDVIEVDIFEEKVPLDILRIGFTGSESTSGITSEKLDISSCK